MTSSFDDAVLPEQTRDDTDQGWGERDRDDDDTSRFTDDLPPHHLDRD